MCLGAVASPVLHTDRLLLTLAAFFFAVGISAHALDELNGHPLGTRLSDRVLAVIGAAGLACAVGLGVYGAATVTFNLVWFIVCGAFLVCAYNLELFGGRFHNDLWFALAWGAFPALTSYFANAGAVDLPGLGVALACLLFSWAQRRLSTPVRTLRRATVSVSGTQTLADGRTLQLSPARLAAPFDASLRVLSLAVVALAVSLVVAKL